MWLPPRLVSALMCGPGDAQALAAQPLLDRVEVRGADAEAIGVFGWREPVVILGRRGVLLLGGRRLGESEPKKASPPAVAAPPRSQAREA